MAYIKKIKNKDGTYTWKGTEEAPRDPITGKRRQITRRGKSKTEVKEQLRLALEEINKIWGPLFPNY